MPYWIEGDDIEGTMYTITHRVDDAGNTSFFVDWLYDPITHRSKAEIELHNEILGLDIPWRQLN